VGNRSDELRAFKAFTLIELLVVIAILALLLAVITSALKKAKFLARQKLCISNVRQQTISFYSYATDNSDRFPEHRAHLPYNARQNFPGLENPLSPWQTMRETYISDSRVLICPITAKLDRSLATTDWIGTATANGRWGGWDGLDRETGERPDHVPIPYSWYANFSPISSSDFMYVNGERAWAQNMVQCASTVTFVTHPVIWLASTSYNAIDNSHGGNFRDGTNPDEWSDSVDNPIGMADGSVKIRLKSRMDKRAVWQSFVFGETIVYY
jgi:prepilin-type N-terminal cleavage/methylation domain-containing protein